MNYRNLVAATFVLSLALTAHASTPLPPANIALPEILSAYRLYKNVTDLQILVPTVIEVPFTEPLFERNDVAIVNTTTGVFEPNFVRITSSETRVSVQTSTAVGNTTSMSDSDTRTYAEFPLPNTAQGRAEVTVTSAQSITSASLVTLLDANVALPTSVEIRAMVGGSDTIVVAKKTVNNNTIQFPKTTSNFWTIIYTYAQPLRISELKLIEEGRASTTKRSVRFLAQPKQSYRIYFNPDRLAIPRTAESANLASAKDVMVLPAGSTVANPGYVISDIDGDSIPDVRDNCISRANADQADLNNNGRGDVCDDFDQDGFINVLDNCPDQPNANQTDTDSDKVGDACDQQESRLTERYAWLPWAGLGFAAFVLIALFAIMVRKTIAAKKAGDQGPPIS